MTKPTFILLVVLLWACSTPQVRPTQESLKDEAYVIMNAIIEDDHLRFYPLCEVPLKPLELETKEWTSEFAAQDKAFMKQCSDSLKGLSFDRGRLVAWDMEKHDWEPIKVVPADDSTFYDEVSWPMFDLKREKALVHFVSNANGMLSGDGRKVLYVKVRGRWKRWKTYDSWIS